MVLMNAGMLVAQESSDTYLPKKNTGLIFESRLGVRRPLRYHN